MERPSDIKDYFSSFNWTEPVANISTSNTPNDLVSTYEYEVKIPDEYRNDFIIQIKASDLRKARKVLLQAKGNRFPLSELLLGLSTTAFGCLFGALCSGVQLDTPLGVVMYCIVPVIAIGAFVAYLFVRKNSINEANSIADQALEILIDPENCEGEQNEYK